jgi:hypothetical protein
MSNSPVPPIPTDRHTPTDQDFNGLEKSDPDLIQAQLNTQAIWIIAGIGTWFLVLIIGAILQAFR